MFKIIQLILILLAFSSIHAQQTAFDFNLKDVWGVERNLYQALDSGKTVVLDFFITNCGTCQINTSTLDSIWNTYGHNGDSLWVWGIECSGRNDSSILAFMQQYHATYPCFSTLNDDVVTFVYNITYTPQYMVVCPDRSMKQVSVNNISSAINGCKSLSYEMQHRDNVIIEQNHKIILPVPTTNWELYTMQGTLINQGHSSNVISLNQLYKGIYLFKWLDSKKNYYKKFSIY